MTPDTDNTLMLLGLLLIVFAGLACAKAAWDGYKLRRDRRQQFYQIIESDVYSRAKELRPQ